MQVFEYFHSHPFYGDLYIKKGFKQKEDFSALVLSILSTIIGHKRHRDISAPALSDFKILTSVKPPQKLWYFDDWHKVFYPPFVFFSPSIEDTCKKLPWHRSAEFLALRDFCLHLVLHFFLRFLRPIEVIMRLPSEGQKPVEDGFQMNRSDHR